MTIGRKLTICFSAICVLFLIFSAAMLNLINGMNKRYAHTVDVSAKKLFLIGELDTTRADFRASLRATILYSYAKRPELIEANLQKTLAAADKAAQLTDELKPLLETDQGKAKAAEISSDFQSWKDKFQTVGDLCKAGKPDEAEAFGTNETKSIAEKTAYDINDLREILLRLFSADKELTDNRALTAKVAGGIAIFLAIAFGVVGFWIVSDITKVLSNIVSDLAQGSEQVSSAAGQISSSAQTLAQGASEQAASLEETASSTGEIMSMTGRNAENTKATMVLMQNTSTRIKEGNSRLEEMHQSMNQITSAAQKISAILKTIDEIAFQTNILALNAAVEAARAGEAGMGFAVVADEVRNLAQRCSQAAKDTHELIEESIRSSQLGRESLENVAKAIAGINEEAEKMKVLVQEVDLGSQEQAGRLQHVDKAVGEMEQVTQRAAAVAEESASAGEELTAQAQALHDLVKTLTALVHQSSEQKVTRPSQAPTVQAKTLPVRYTPPPQACPSIASTAVSPADPEWMN